MCDLKTTCCAVLLWVLLPVNIWHYISAHHTLTCGILYSFVLIPCCPPSVLPHPPLALSNHTHLSLHFHPQGLKMPFHCLFPWTVYDWPMTILSFVYLQVYFLQYSSLHHWFSAIWAHCVLFGLGLLMIYRATLIWVSSLLSN